MFKSAEERESARREREAEEAREREAWAEQAREAARVFVSGDNTAVSGTTVGVYLFRNTRLR